MCLVQGATGNLGAQFPPQASSWTSQQHRQIGASTRAAKQCLHHWPVEGRQANSRDLNLIHSWLAEGAFFIGWSNWNDTSPCLHSVCNRCGQTPVFTLVSQLSPKKRAIFSKWTAAVQLNREKRERNVILWMIGGWMGRNDAALFQRPWLNISAGKTKTE